MANFTSGTFDSPTFLVICKVHWIFGHGVGLGDFQKNPILPQTDRIFNISRILQTTAHIGLEADILRQCFHRSVS